MIAPGSVAAAGAAPARAAVGAAATPGPATGGEAAGDPLLALPRAGAAPFSEAIAALRVAPRG